MKGLMCRQKRVETGWNTSRERFFCLIWQQASA
jgi:hypothetical protein